MTKEELEHLFMAYLNREPTKKEYDYHLKKKYSAFEHEISTCEERKNLKVGVDKFAIIISGHVRKNTILSGILKHLSGYQYDVFIHTWDNLGLKGNETKLDDKVDMTKVISEINKIPNVKKYSIENNKQYISGLEDKKGYFNLSSPEKFIKSQLYSINKSYSLLEEYVNETNQNYSMVLKIRFDSELIDFLLNDAMIKDINKNDIIFVPNKDNKHEHLDNGTSCWACDKMYYTHKLKSVHIFEHTNVICDLFAYGSFNSMKSYCNLYNVYDILIDSFHEQNMQSYKKHNKNIKFENGDYKLKLFPGHIDSLYYYNCSYPERLLQKYLKDYMLIESKNIKLRLVR